MTVSIATTVAEATELLSSAPSPVVVIPVYDSYDDVVCCLGAVVTHTSSTIAVLIVDDGGADRRVMHLLSSVSPDLDREIVVLQHDNNEGFVRSCNDAFAATPGRDVVILNSDVVVGAEWLERLAAAALSSDSVATASTLTNHGTIVSVPDRNHPTRTLPDHMAPNEAARLVASGSLQLRPIIPTAIGHCFYVRRHVIDLLGCFDESFDPGYGEEVDFSQRAIAHGFCHVLADDVFTYHRGGSSFGDKPDVVARKARHEALVRHRYPWYGPWVERTATDPASPLAHALGTARRSLLGLTIGIDGLCLGPYRTGTQEVTIQTIRALARRREINRLVVFIPPHVPDYVNQVRNELPAVEFIGVNPYAGLPGRVVDLIYRPYQVSEIVELDFLHQAGDRFVVNQLDMIAFDNPAYFGSDELWLRYRDVTRLTLELAHGIAFLSDRIRQAVIDEGLYTPGTPSAVVSCGVDAPESLDEVTRPDAVLPDDVGFLLCVGASYHHKNRRFALELWSELRRRGWAGKIVLVGPTPPHGTSLAREAEFLLRVPELRSEAIYLGAVTDAEKRWLYQNAALVLYPSAIEGFGLVPFEAAQHGTPTLATRRGSLDEVLPAGIPVLDGFDVGRGADRAWQLLDDPSGQAALIETLLVRGLSFTWDATAERLMNLFGEALRQPRGRVLVLEGEGDSPVGLVARAQRANSVNGSVQVLERFVHAVVSRPGWKNGLSPDGSRRQRVARKVISEARQRMH